MLAVSPGFLISSASPTLSDIDKKIDELDHASGPTCLSDNTGRPSFPTAIRWNVPRRTNGGLRDVAINLISICVCVFRVSGGRGQLSAAGAIRVAGFGVYDGGIMAKVTKKKAVAAKPPSYEELLQGISDELTAGFHELANVLDERLADLVRAARGEEEEDGKTDAD